MDEFAVFIDESGDEGFVFKADGSGSTRWFALSALVMRQEAIPETDAVIDEVKAVLGKTDPAFCPHFRKLCDEQRVAYADLLVRKPFQTVTILIHKPSIQDPAIFAAEKYSLYHHATRFLLERVSWLCRGVRRSPDGRARIIFSNRAAMSYQDLRDYLIQLKIKAGLGDVRIDWSVIDPEDISSEPHPKLRGLQVADAVATGIYYGFARNLYGHTEPRYAEILAPIVYAHDGRRLGYGLEVWPREVASLLDTDEKLAWVRKIYR
jgi:hypothetical protein